MDVFFFNDTATTEIYTLSLHDALPISTPRSRYVSASRAVSSERSGSSWRRAHRITRPTVPWSRSARSEEHTSELQSRQYLVCRLLLEKKKNIVNEINGLKTITKL